MISNVHYIKCDLIITKSQKTIVFYYLNKFWRKDKGFEENKILIIRYKKISGLKINFFYMNILIICYIINLIY